MKINPQIKAVLDEYNINYVEGMLCLFAIYYELRIPEHLETVFSTTLTQLNVSKIVERDYTTKTLRWNVSLYAGEETNWLWVGNEYRSLFTSVNKLRGGSITSCVKRMKKFFQEHPEVRKNDVIEAAKLYINSVSDPEYLQQADYFIEKDRGPRTTSRLEQFIEIVRTKKVDIQHKIMY